MGCPLVSVVFITFNHARWVEQALTSVLDQTRVDRIELVWQDDASTDDTVARVEALLAARPVPVKRLVRRVNRMSRGVPCHLDLIEACEGEFVAMLEGDDHWTDPDKLRVQCEAMQRNPGIDLCCSRARVVTDDPPPTHLPKYVGDLGDQPGVAPLSAVIRGDGGFMHTSSLLVRREVLAAAPAWYFEAQPVGDYMIQVVGATRGGALYLPRIMSAYRMQSAGSWSERVAHSPDARATFEVGFIRLLRRMQRHYGEVHKADFDAILVNHLCALARLSVQQDRPVALVQAASALLAD